MQKDKQFRLGILKNLMIIAGIDGYVDFYECSLLVDFSEQLHLDEEDISHVVLQMDNLDFFVPTEREDRIHMLTNLVVMSQADGKLTVKEYETLVRFCEIAEIEKKILDKMIANF